MLVRETAGALAGLGFDSAGLVTACRRILDRHPASGPIWWLCSRVLTADDPRQEAWAAADELDADRTASELAHALPADSTVAVLGWPDQIGEALPWRGDVEVLVVDALGEGSGLVRRLCNSDVDAVDVPMSGLGAAVAAADLVLLEASAIGPPAFVSVAGARAAAAVAVHGSVPVWLVGGTGRVLPVRLFDALARRLDDMADPWDLDDDVVPLDLVTALAGPNGLGTVADALAHIDCPIAPELFKSVDPL
jgi:hypothetical protein